MCFYELIVFRCGHSVRNPTEYCDPHWQNPDQKCPRLIQDGPEYKVDRLCEACDRAAEKARDEAEEKSRKAEEDEWRQARQQGTAR